MKPSSTSICRKKWKMLAPTTAVSWAALTDGPMISVDAVSAPARRRFSPLPRCHLPARVALLHQGERIDRLLEWERGGHVDGQIPLGGKKPRSRRLGRVRRHEPVPPA